MNVIGNLKSAVRRSRKSLVNRFSVINRNPIIVLGNQKSGTTAIAALIARATRSDATLDFFHHLPYQERAILEGRSTLASFISSNKSFFSKPILKEPALAFQLDAVVKQFPGSRIVFVLREPLSNVRSILNRLDLPGTTEALSDAQRETFNRKIPEWHDILVGRLFRHGDPNPVICLVKRALLAHKICLKNRTDLIVVRYEDFLGDKQNRIALLCEKLGLAVSCDIAPFLNVQYQPKGDNTASFENFFGEANLKRIRPILEKEENAECLQRNGYRILD